jgi:predicted RNase H-like nuclease (RuvC/YqgF family)
MNILAHTADAVGEALGIDIRSRTRMIDYVEARAIYYNLCRNRYDFTLFRIGREVDRDHASVMHGLKIYENLMATDGRFRNKARLVEQYVISGEVVPNEEHTPCDELVSENKRLKIQIKELTLRAESLEREFDSMSRLATMVDRLKQKIPRGKELEAEKQLNRFLNGIRF